MVDGYERRGGPQRIRPGQRVLQEVDIVRMVADHAALRHLCDALEDCANQLPNRVAVMEAAGISAAIADSFGRPEIASNTILTSLFDGDTVTAMNPLLARIRHRQGADQLHAEDLCDALSAAVKSDGAIPSDLLSYMMRCLFDGCRRCIDLHEATILLLAHNRLTPAARVMLCASLAEVPQLIA